MNDQGEQTVHGWRHRLPLVLGTIVIGQLFIYVVFPGFVIGVLIRAQIFDPTPSSVTPGTKAVLDRVFFVPKYLAENVESIRSFYAWQIFVVTGHRKTEHG